uniref:Uncharacterized protein n=1 Tax=Lepeophtheirus salmonis TaxID=72036 RepID=A0A0K2T967_LEPSM
MRFALLDNLGHVELGAFAGPIDLVRIQLCNCNGSGFALLMTHALNRWSNPKKNLHLPTATCTGLQDQKSAGCLVTKMYSLIETRPEPM